MRSRRVQLNCGAAGAVAPARMVGRHADTRTMIVGRPEPALDRWAHALYGAPTER